MSAGTDALGELGRLAAALGVELAYWDTGGHRHVATPDALVAVLRSMGAPVEHPERLDDLRRHVGLEGVRPLEPVVVHWLGRPEVRVDVRLREGQAHRELVWVVEHEGGGTTEGSVRVDDAPEVARHDLDGRTWSVRRLELPVHAGLAPGYHRLSIVVGGERHEATLVAAPEQVAQPDPAERVWGVLAPVYALPPSGPTGPGVRDLAELGRWTDAHGGRVVATLPMLATYLDEPCDPSPYTPVSQRFWNELYLDVEATPELAASEAARALLAEPARRDALRRLAADELFDHRAQYRLVRPVLDELARTFFAGAPDSAEFERWLAADPAAGRYATFRAATEASGTGWHAWDVPPGEVPAGTDPDGPAARFHQYAQWRMRTQMADLARDLGGRDQRLYLDLPVGTHGDGFDTWSQHDLFAWGCGVGAPPDDFFGGGQNWGFPPVNPLQARAQGHRHFAACIRHHMSAAGILRLDHVMGLHRLYWVPDGAGAKDGVYVRYPQEELMAVLAVESARSDCRVVGEDLGTVPDEVRHALDRHGLLGMFVSQFQLPDAHGRMAVPGDRQVASLDTHDTPTFAGWMRGLDVGIRQDMGLLDEHDTATAYRDRQRDADRTIDVLREAGLLGERCDEHAILVALLRWLGASPAAAVLVGADDLVGETDPQNVPGTGLDRPNWVRKLKRSVADLAADPSVGAALDALQAARLSAHARAQEEPT